MRRIHPVFIVLFIVLIILVLYVLIAKPTLVLPTVVVTPEQSGGIAAYQQQMNINQLDVKIRSNGQMFLLADGKDLGTINYDPVTLKNGVDLAQRVGLQNRERRIISLLPILAPQLVLNAAVTGQILYFTLPIEITVRFIRG